MQKTHYEDNVTITNRSTSGGKRRVSRHYLLLILTFFYRANVKTNSSLAAAVSTVMSKKEGSSDKGNGTNANIFNSVGYFDTNLFLLFCKTFYFCGCHGK